MIGWVFAITNKFKQGRKAFEGIDFIENVAEIGNYDNDTRAVKDLRKKKVKVTSENDEKMCQRSRSCPSI